MAFGPTLPPNGASTLSAVMRSQLTGLFDLIQTIPVGRAGDFGERGGGRWGDDGAGGRGGDGGALFDGANVRFTFGLPRGLEGQQGPPGVPGPQDVSETARSPGVTNLALTASDPPMRSELQHVIDKVNGLMNTLRRPMP